MTLAGKIALASIEVGNFKADKKNMEQKYAYISADQVLSRAGDALAKQGVTVFPSLLEVELTTIERQGKSARIDAKITYSMMISDGEKDIVIPWFGYGSDYMTPDKAVYKAITSGHKYFLMKLLNIGVGNEDGEHEVENTQNVILNGLPVENISQETGEVVKPIRIIDTMSDEAVTIASQKWNIGKPEAAKELGKKKLSKMGVTEFIDWLNDPQAGMEAQ
jgi:hypothetical protein